jgi:putative hydrolase of HD superfamily
MEKIARFIFELGMLKKTPRTGYQFLGNGHESVAAHSYRTIMIAYILAKEQGEVDVWRTVAMAMVHDVAEARTADHNYVNKKYVEIDEAKATADQMEGLDFGPELAEYKGEFEKAETMEAKLARDADQLDLIFQLKEHQDLGNSYAPKWIKAAYKRLTTPLAKKLARQACETDWSSWWFTEGDPWWVHGGRNQEES